MPLWMMATIHMDKESLDSDDASCDGVSAAGPAILPCWLKALKNAKLDVERKGVSLRTKTPFVTPARLTRHGCSSLSRTAAKPGSISFAL
jgi:hypothetical protein